MSDLSDFARRVCEPEIAALKAKLREAEREQAEYVEEVERERDEWKRRAETASVDDAHDRAEAAEAREKVLREALTDILEHNPLEVVKDDFAYDRLKAAYHECARAALATPDPGATE